MQNLNKEFSEVELDLINQYTKKNKGVLTKVKTSQRDKFFISSESLSTCIRVTDLKERTIFVCENRFGTYFDVWVRKPNELKNALGL